MADKIKKAGKTSKILGVSLLSAGMLIATALAVTVSVVTTTAFDNVLSQYFKTSPDRVEADGLGADLQYVKSDYASSSELYKAEEKLCAEIAQDGATLLRNENLLPLAGGTQLDLYSVSSVNLVSGGSGSGSGSFELTADLKQGLEHAGFKVNETLWNFYKSGAGAKYQRGAGVINYGRGYEWGINECPIDTLKGDQAVMSSIDKSHIAMFVISRTGGEGGDEPRDMAEFGGKAGEHYLELNADEKDTIRFLGENYDNVIILVNANNAFELGFLSESSVYKNITAVINFPGAGRTGTYGLGNLLRGKDDDGKEFSPSGHLVDTFVYDNFSSPAIQNFGDCVFTDKDGRIPMFFGADVTYSNGQYGSNADNINEDAGRCPFYFVTYNEGIYVGYRYYETRYEDYVLGTENVGNYDYAKTVTYPFGFGSSYTKFAWSGYSVSSMDFNGNMTVSVSVKNDGDKAGRDVVQIYAQAPYNGTVEKSAVQLAGFTKTKLLAPGESETVEVKLNINDLRSYDDSGEGKYFLDMGDYYITAAEDAHQAVNNILKLKCDGDASKLGRIVETSDVTGVPGIESTKNLAQDVKINYSMEYGNVKNRFDYASIIDRKDYLSRKAWNKMDDNGLRYATDHVKVECPGVGKNPWGNTHIAGCAEMDGKQWRAVMPDGLLEKLCSSDSRIPEDKKKDNSVAPVLNQKHDVELIDLRGLPLSDPKWDLLLEETNVEELSKLIAQCGYCSPAMPSIVKPKVSDLDGPAGLNLVVGHGSSPIGDGLVAMTWVTEYMLACTWDEELALKMGEGVGEDGLHGNVVGWYGPAMNIHRTPFAGRNFEYYSEDPFLSGVMGKNEVQGAARKGLYGFVKHFALNDQETHRDQNGLITFSNEQAMREIYFRPFEILLKQNNVTVKYNEAIRDANNVITGYKLKYAEIPATTAIMSSFNRLGPTWAGGNYDLITGVLREEFGFEGFVLTDYDTGNYMVNNTKQMLEAGGDAKLNTIGTWDGLTKGDKINENVAYAKDAAKHILYCVVNSAAMNGFAHGAKIIPGFANYKYIVIGVDVACGLGVVVMGFFLFRLLARKRPKDEPEA